MKKRLTALLLAIALVCALLPATLLTASAEIVDGYCPTGLDWRVNTETGVLEITGTGVIEDHYGWVDEDGRVYTRAGWGNYRAYIKTVIIGTDVTRIGSYAFAGLYNVTSVTIPDGMTGIGASAFEGCSSLTGITIPDYVTRIGDSAFKGCSSLTDIKIPNSVTRIGKSAFEGCSSLTDVTIPDSVTDFGYDVFKDCTTLTSVSIPGSFSRIASFFENCTSLESITIGDGVEEIYPYACKNLTALKRINIPDSVTRIGTEAFDGCTALTDVTIGDGVTWIQRNAFHDCTALTNVKLGNSVRWIDTNVFEGCTSLTSIVIPDSVERINDYAFQGCTGLTCVTMGSGIKHMGWKAFIDCTALTEVHITDLTAWCAIDFWDIANPLYYAENLYLNGTLITDLVIPDGLESILPMAFTGCGMRSVTIPNSVTSIGRSAFDNCKALTSITIPNSVTSIGIGAFYGCTGLTTIMIPNSVTSIWSAAFEYCDALTDVYYGGTEAEWNAIDIGAYNEALKEANIHDKDGAHIHSYTADVTSPTCTEQGYTTHTCLSCGYSYKDSYKDALGHAFVDGVCTRCKAKDPNYKPEDPTEPTEPTEPTNEPSTPTEATDPTETTEPTEPTETVEPVEFNDVKENAWYYDAVNYAVTNGLMNGVGNNNFAPDDPMTRAMLVTVLWRYEGSPIEGSNVFADVAGGQWYTQAVAWAAYNGIVGGVGNGKFDPNGNITREQMAAILFRYAEKKGFDTSKRGDLSAFPDASKVSSYAKDAIKWAVAEGIIGGSDGKLLPQGNATRAQVSTILMRFIEGIAK